MKLDPVAMFAKNFSYSFGQIKMFTGLLSNYGPLSSFLCGTASTMLASLGLAVPPAAIKAGAGLGSKAVNSELASKFRQEMGSLNTAKVIELGKNLLQSPENNNGPKMR
jgi:hypothetical protein